MYVKNYQSKIKEIKEKRYLTCYECGTKIFEHPDSGYNLYSLLEMHYENAHAITIQDWKALRAENINADQLKRK